MIYWHCSHLVEFEVIGEDSFPDARRARRVCRSLARVMGIEDVAVSHEAQRIFVAFNPVLITADDLGERFAMLGYVVRQATGLASMARPQWHSLH